MSVTDLGPGRDDYAASVATTGVVSVGGSTTGNIESTGDEDWFRVTLTAGRSYQIDLEASDTGQGTLPDPYLWLRDSAGNYITTDSDGGIGNNARITFAPSVSGTYYLVAESSSSSDLGTYKMSVTDLGGNNPPVITSNGGNSTAKVSVAENMAAVTTVVASDPGDTVTYSISGGADASRFSINATTGALAFKAPPDFEAPTDANKNNVYEVTVKATDSKGASDMQSLAVTVVDVSGAPITGTAKNNTLNGTGEAETIRGLGGKDKLNGLGGNDVLIGGAGNDTLTGGAGADSFAFSDKLKKNVDKIVDFVPGTDRILLDNAVFTKAGADGVLAESAFHIGKKAADKQDRILYDAPKGTLLYDLDGKSGKKAVAFAKIGKGLDIDADDFLVI